MSVVQKLMADEVAYKIWRFLCEYPKKDLKHPDSGTIFETNFASFLEKVKDYSIVGRSTDKVETAAGIFYPPDMLVSVNTLSETFIVFECKSGKNVVIDDAAAFFAKVHNVAHKNELNIFRSGGISPLKYNCRKLYRVLISAREPTKDSLGFCWGNGIPVFYPAELPEGIVPLKVVRHRLSLFVPSDPDQEKSLQYYHVKIAEIDRKMFCEARENPRDHREFLGDIRSIINGVNTLINRRWII